MKKICIILFAGLLVSAELQAQKVYKDGTKVILDLTEAAGMPAGAITNVSKAALYANANSGNNVALANNDQNGTINAKVFQKLEIASSNYGGTINWATAFNGCRSQGQGWRLPTQRELMLMWIFKDALESLSGVAFVTADPPDYWSATETNAASARIVNLSTGNTAGVAKTNSNRARCVREVTTP
jgi:hypothetical protein